MSFSPQSIFHSLWLFDQKISSGSIHAYHNTHANAHDCEHQSTFWTLRVDDCCDRDSNRIFLTWRLKWLRTQTKVICRTLIRFPKKFSLLPWRRSTGTGCGTSCSGFECSLKCQRITSARRRINSYYQLRRYNENRINEIIFFDKKNRNLRICALLQGTNLWLVAPDLIRENFPLPWKNVIKKQRRSKEFSLPERSELEDTLNVTVRYTQPPYG